MTLGSTFSWGSVPAFHLWASIDDVIADFIDDVSDDVITDIRSDVTAARGLSGVAKYAAKTD